MENTTVLCIDLDRTLARGDLLHECAVNALVRRPWLIAPALYRLTRGRAALKAFLADRAELDFSLIPLNPEVVELGRARAAAGARVFLATAAAARVAEGMVRAHPWLTAAISSDGAENLKGAAKARRLVERFGVRGFDYVGDSRADEEIFKVAHRSTLVTRDPGRARAFTRTPDRAALILKPSATLRSVARAARPHQWTKNALILVPLILSHGLDRADAWTSVALAFACFSLCASSVYVFNDLADVEADRAHEAKRRRPVAAGDLGALTALGFGLLLLGASFLLAGMFTSAAFVGTLAGYFALTTLYSFWLKRELMIDVVCLALLYTLRIVAGTVAARAPSSHWLLAFSMFIFLSLAMLKRSAELVRLRERGRERTVGRAYHAADFAIVQAIGVAAGLTAVLVCVLYLDSEIARRLYQRPEYLMLVIPLLLFWIGRAWVLGARGLVAEDPVVWAIKDRASHLILILIGFLMFMAS